MVFTSRVDEELQRKYASVLKANELKKMESSAFEQKYASLILFIVVLVILTIHFILKTDYIVH